MHENLLAISRMYTEEERTKMIFKNKEGRKAAWERKEREEKGRLFFQLLGQKRKLQLLRECCYTETWIYIG